MARKAFDISTIFHLVFFTVFSVSLLWDFFVVVTPPGSRDDICRKSTFGRIKYQSYINVIFFQWAYTALALLNDLVGTNVTQDSKKSFLQKTRDFMFSSLSFPFGVGVMVFFWVGYFVDRDSVYPPDMDLWKPAIINHINHTLPGIVMLLELVLVSHKMVKGYLKYIPGVVFVVGYFVMLSHFVIGQKLYIYPTSHKDTYLSFARSAIGESILMCFMAYLCEKMDSLVSGKSKAQKAPKKQQQKSKKDSKKKQQKKAPETATKKTPPQEKPKAQPKKEQAKPQQAKKEQVKPQQAKKEQAKPQGKKEQAKPQPAKKEQAKPQPAKKEQAKPQQAKKEQAKKPAPADNKVRQRKK